MIASISGRIQEIFNDSLIVEVGGVGFQIYVPAPTRDHLHAGETIFLATYLVVREDLLALYGFETREMRDFFTLLLGVNGIGPKLALNILSTLSTDAVRRAVFQEQADVLSRVPGVGKKTAQKILLHLQDRLPAMTGIEAVATLSDIDGEVLSALTTLGYSVVEAQAALQSIPRNTPQDLEERLRLALKYFT